MQNGITKLKTETKLAAKEDATKLQDFMAISEY
jgi:hypothetical protein